jgi:hypothetical protein
MSTLAATNLKHASSASNNIVLDSSGNATFAGTAVPSSSFLRNRIINGGFDVWQRGTTFSSPSGGAYLADRYFTFFASITSFSRNTDAPTGFRYSAEIVGTDVSVYQKIEDLNCDNIAGGAVTFSFYAKNISGSGGLSVTLLSPTAANNYASYTTIYSASVSASPSASWTRYTVTANVDANIVNGLQVQITRSGAATTRVTGVQLEVGTAATPFERRQFGQELALCQRYYWTSTQSGVSATQRMYLSNTGSTVRYFTSYYPVTMRASPTISGTVSAGTFSAYGNNANLYGAQSTGLANDSVSADISAMTANAEL